MNQKILKFIQRIKSFFQKSIRVLFVVPKRNIYRWYLLKKLSRLSGSPVPLTKGDHRGFAFLAGFLKGRQTTPKPLLSKEGRRLSSLKFWQWPLDKLGVKKELFMFWRWEKNDLRQLLKKLHTTPFKIAFTISVFALILANIFFQQAPNTALSATFYFTQSDWSGGISGTAAVHPTDATNWNKFTSTSSVFAGSDLVVTSSIGLATTTPTTVTHTADTDFSGGTFSGTETIGTGSGAYVAVSTYSPPAVWSALSNITWAGDGAEIVSTGDDYLYAFGGGGNNYFYRFSISGGSWTAMTSLGNISTGGSLVYPGSGDYIYASVGGGGFYRYSISGNSWSALTSLSVGFGAGAALAHTSSGDYIYALAGGGTQYFYRYSISGNSWSAMSNISGTVNIGGSLVYPGSGDYIYALRGQNGSGYQTNNFYRYSISGNSWSSMTDTAYGVGQNASLAFPDSGDYIYVIDGSWIGYGNALAQRYSISGNSWGALTSGTYNFNRGSSWVYPGTGEYLYALHGDSSYFRRYNMAAEGASTHRSFGYFISPVIDFGSVKILHQLSFTASTTVSFSVRAGDTASPDSTWTNWEHRIANNGSLSALGSHRYVQYKATMTTNGATPATMEDVSISYYTYAGAGSLISSPYDFGSDFNLIGGLSWNEGGVSATYATTTISLRVASTQGGLSTAEWIDFTYASSTCSKTGGAVSCPLSSVPGWMKDGANDRWVQYKVTLGSLGGQTNYVDNISLTYVVNAPPASRNITPTPNSDGKVVITYQLSDEDTEDGSPANAGYVTTTFQYWDGDSWENITTIENGSTYQGQTFLHQAVAADNSWTAYTATWTPYTDFPSVYNTGAQIRITVNDGELANYTSTTDSGTFILDTKAATPSSITIDATSTPAVAYLTATDDSAVQMKVGLASDLSDAEWEAFASSKKISDTLTDPDTVYAQFKDAYGNTTAIVSATTITTPLSFIVQDTSNILDTATDYRLFVAWKTIDAPPNGFGSYKVYRANSVDGTTCSGVGAGDYTLISTGETRTTNYYTDQPIEYNLVYCYKVVSLDSLGNTSFSTTPIPAKADGTQNYGEGGGGNVSANTPVITNVASNNLTPTMALITWDTDVLSNSEVLYSTTMGEYTSSLIVSTMVDNPASIGGHAVALTGLAPNTTYYYMVSSSNIGNLTATSTCGNPYEEGCTFMTTDGVTITGVSNPEITNASAKIIWNTSGLANSYVIYSTSPTMLNPATSSLDTYDTSHSISLTGLTSATKYYYYVQSTTEGGITAQDKNAVNGTIEYYSFNTTNDSQAPFITNVKSTPSTTSTEITWTTVDDPSTSQVEYGLSTSYNASTTFSSTLTVQHAQTLNNLTASTLYHFRVISRDANNNQTTSTDYTFTTIAEPVTIIEYVGRGAGGAVTIDTSPPNITSLKILNITQTGATVSWTTDELSSSLVRHGKTIVYTAISGQDADRVTDHTVKLVALEPNTIYHYRAVSYDAAGNGGETLDGVFKTLAVGEIAPLTPEEVKKEEEAAAPKELLVDGLNEEQRNIIASIRKASDVFLIKILEALKNNPSLTDIPEEIFVKAFSEMTDKIVEAPSIVGIRPAVEVQGTTVIVKWTTDKKTDSMVLFAKEGNYNPDSKDPYDNAAVNPNEFSTYHEVTISNLEPASVYHFQVKSKGLVGPEAKSADFTFRTGSELPKITDVSVLPGKDTSSVTANWRTNIPTAATLEYTNLTTNRTMSQGDATLLVQHNFILKNLDPGASYLLTIKARDEFGNEVSSLPIRFSTSKDEFAPAITKVSSESTLYPGKESRVQTIISWETDEPATSQVFFQEGLASSTPIISLPIDTTLNTRHISVVTAFKSGTVYKYWVESKDTSGNTTKSAIYSVLTPQETETIIDIMINNFEQVFGWTKRIGF